MNDLTLDKVKAMQFAVSLLLAVRKARAQKPITIGPGRCTADTHARWIANNFFRRGERHASGRWVW